MQKIYETKREPLTLKIKVHAYGVPVQVVVKDVDRPNTYYMNRFKTIKGKQDFIIRMPQSPNRALVQIFNARTKDDDGFKILDAKREPLETQMSAFDFSNPLIAEFILFAQDFCDKAGYLSTGTYNSLPKANFTIQYVDAIRSKNGTILNTPARINSLTGIIQVSKSAFAKYTVAGRFAILCHEFAHVFANKNVKSEIESDFHAATIYLALGYPRIEILNVFTKVFAGANTALNQKRLKLMNDFIMNFDNKIFSVRYN